MKVQLDWAHHGVGLLRTEAQLESAFPEPDYRRRGSARVQLESSPHGAGLPQTIQLESVPEGTRLLQTNALDMVPPAAVHLRVGVQLVPVPLGTWLLGTRLQAVGLPPRARRVLLPWSPVELELALESLSTDNWARADSQSLTTADSQGAISSGNWMSYDKSQATSSETSSCDLSPRELRSLRMPVQLEPFHRKTDLPQTDLTVSRGKDRSGQDQTLFVHTVMATDGADTTDRGSSVKRMHGTAATSGTAGTDLADMVWVVSMTMHTAGNTGSQSTQLTGPSQQQVPQPVIQNCRNEEFRPSHKNSYQFSLQCQLMTEMRRCPLFP